MTDAAAFRATYSDLKVVKSRGVVQIVFEAPVENDAQILAVLGGMPRAAKERWFAIARLNTVGGADGEISSHTHNSRLKITDNGKGVVARNALTTRAALLCNDPQFRLFLERTYLPRGNHCNTEDDAARIVRPLCGVESRSEIQPGTPAADKWERLYTNFIVWKNADRYVEAPRIHEENKAARLST